MSLKGVKVRSKIARSPLQKLTMAIATAQIALRRTPWSWGLWRSRERLARCGYRYISRMTKTGNIEYAPRASVAKHDDLLVTKIDPLPRPTGGMQDETLEFVRLIVLRRLAVKGRSVTKACHKLIWLLQYRFVILVRVGQTLHLGDQWETKSSNARNQDIVRFLDNLLLLRSV